MGGGSCECPSSSYLIDTSERSVRSALGPAYEDYKSGKVHIRTTWEQDKSLEPYYLPSCCANLSEDFTRGELWFEHTIFMAFFLATGVVLLGFFIALRDQQPFKFRDVKAVTLLNVIVMGLFVLAVLIGNNAGTFQVIPGVICMFCGGPIITYYYTVKALQLRYVISWGEAKLKKNNYEQIQRFYKFRFLLDFRCYVAGLFAVLIITGVPAIYALTQRDLFKHVMTQNEFSTLRCEWYHIPAEYQQPTSNSQLCECVKSSFDVEGESDPVLCYEAYQNKCETLVADDDDEVNSGFCEACSNAFSTGDIKDKQCTDYFTEFVLEGNCGFPSMTPVASTCVASINADRVMGYVCGSITFAFTLLNLLALIPLIGKRDDYGMIFENVFTTVICNGVSIFAVSTYFEDNLGMLDWYYDDLGIKYRAQCAFVFLSCSVVVLCSLGIPLVMWLYRTKWWKPMYSDQVNNDAGHDRNLELMVTSGAEPFERPDIGSILHVKHPRTEFEAAVEQCIKNSGLLAIYSEYAVEAFHIENVRFLEETHQFFKMVESHADIADLCVKATQISVQFITSSAAFEVNLPAKMRKGVDTHLDLMIKLMTPVPNDPREENPAKAQELRSRRASDVLEYGTLDALVESLAQAYLEVRKLLAGDTWDRFQTSRFYQQYQTALKELKEQESRLTTAISMIDHSAPALKFSFSDHSMRRPSDAENRLRTHSSPSVLHGHRRPSSGVQQTTRSRTGTDSELRAISEDDASMLL